MYKIFFLNKKKAMQTHVCIAFFIQDTPSVCGMKNRQHKNKPPLFFKKNIIFVLQRSIQTGYLLFFNKKKSHVCTTNKIEYQ